MEDLIPQDNMHKSNPVWLGGYKGFFYYMQTYENTIKILIQKIKDDNHKAEDVLFPFLFLIRHCLELGYKANLIHFKEFIEEEFELNRANHNLKFLHNEFTTTINKVNSKLNDEYGIELTEDDKSSYDSYFNEVNNLKNIFHTIDKYSMAFRYPVDKDNNQFFDDTQRIDLKPVIELFQKTIIFLNHTSDVYEQYFDCASDMKRDFL